MRILHNNVVLALGILLICVFILNHCTQSESFDIVILNGRIMDPYSRTDVFANLGLKDGKIAAIVSAGQALSGETVIEATDLIVAPGFINIHGHEGIIDKTMEVSVRDGVTTIIGGNCGGACMTEDAILSVGKYLDMLDNAGMYSNFATFSGHSTLRLLAGVSDVHTSATEEQLAKILTLLTEDMKAGALGVSFGPFYVPGTTYEEMMASAAKCAELKGGASIHVRYGTPLRPKPADEPLNIQAIREGIRLAKESGVPMIISHNGGASFGPVHSGMALQIMYTAMEEGVKLVSDVHPYDAFNTSLSAPVFAPPVFAEQLPEMGAQISDIKVQNSVVIDDQVVMKSLEPFSSIEQFNSIRNKVLAREIPDPGIIGHFYPSHMTLTWMQAPFVMIENDGAVDRDKKTGELTAHPRIAGSYSKFLGYWVREKGVCDLMTGLSKSSTMAAVWLGLKNKGRINIGADADLVLFNPKTVIDKATYKPDEVLTPPEGIPYVIVNGVLVVQDGQLTGNKPGKTIRRTWDVPGTLVNHGILPGIEVADLVREN
jgi:N-acyl-D-aspartate/D-glutamate deacylase